MVVDVGWLAMEGVVRLIVAARVEGLRGLGGECNYIDIQEALRAMMQWDESEQL